jgi:hypothetical protein
MLFALGAPVGKLFDEGYCRHLIVVGSLIYVFSLFMVSAPKDVTYLEVKRIVLVVHHEESILSGVFGSSTWCRSRFRFIVFSRFANRSCSEQTLMT